MVVFTVLLGLVYPLVDHRHRPGRVQRQGRTARSSSATARSSARRCIGQAFTDAEGRSRCPVLPARPSAASGVRATTAAGYDPTLSSGSNLGPDEPRLPRRRSTQRVDGRTAKLNGLGADAKVPVDAVTASGSGLDPHISVANARLQAPRVADERGISVADGAPARSTTTPTGRALGFLGEKAVNVLELNLALDRARPVNP